MMQEVQAERMDAGTACCSGAVILSAGFSTRMKRFKPLLMLGGETVLAHVVHAWQEAGIERIMVVSGCQAEAVEAEALALGVRAVRNPHPEDGMFSSAITGLSAFFSTWPEAAWAGFQPVDIPLIGSGTIRAMAQAARERLAAGSVSATGTPVLYPEYHGAKGHPPFVCRSLMDDLARFSGGGGLRAFLEQYACGTVPVEDPHIDRDMDHPGDYEEICAILGVRPQ